MRNDSGNILFLILIGVALFAALQFAMSRGSQVNMTGDKERSSLAADQIIRYAMDLENAVKQIRGSGFSESEISFEHAELTGYTNSNASPESEIFAINGGGATYQAPNTAWQTSAAPWYFTGQTCINQIGDYDADCVNNGRPELIAFLPNVTRDICVAINQKSGVPMSNSTPPRDVSAAWTGSAPFTGAFTSAQTVAESSNTAFSGKKIGCFEGGTLPSPGTYNVYAVLLAR